MHSIAQETQQTKSTESNCCFQRNIRVLALESITEKYCENLCNGLGAGMYSFSAFVFLSGMLRS